MLFRTGCTSDKLIFFPASFALVVLRTLPNRRKHIFKYLATAGISADFIHNVVFGAKKMEGENDMLEQVIVLVWCCYLSLRVDNTRIYVNESIVCQMSVFRRQT